MMADLLGRSLAEARSPPRRRRGSAPAAPDGRSGRAGARRPAQVAPVVHVADHPVAPGHLAGQLLAERSWRPRSAPGGRGDGVPHGHVEPGGAACARGSARRRRTASRANHRREKRSSPRKKEPATASTRAVETDETHGAQPAPATRTRSGSYKPSSASRMTLSRLTARPMRAYWSSPRAEASTRPGGRSAPSGPAGRRRPRPADRRRPGPGPSGAGEQPGQRARVRTPARRPSCSPGTAIESSSTVSDVAVQSAFSSARAAVRGQRPASEGSGGRPALNQVATQQNAATPTNSRSESRAPIVGRLGDVPADECRHRRGRRSRRHSHAIRWPVARGAQDEPTQHGRRPVRDSVARGDPAPAPADTPTPGPSACIQTGARETAPASRSSTQPTPIDTGTPSSARCSRIHRS